MPQFLQVVVLERQLLEMVLRHGAELRHLGVHIPILVVVNQQLMVVRILIVEQILSLLTIRQQAQQVVT